MTVDVFTLQCQEEGCGWQKIVQYALGAGWSLGLIVPFDPTNPAKAMCSMCRKCNMKVVSAPTPKTTFVPKGFSKVPTE